MEPFVSGVSLGADSKVDAPKVNAQFCIRGTGREAELVDAYTAYRWVHRPEDSGQWKAARKRLRHEEAGRAM